jgi:hypothetical protein
MNSHGNRARLGGVLVAVAAILALVALPGLASGHRNHGDDPAPAGTISSFDQETGLLTIDLSDGGSVSGLVTRRTHIRCDNGRHRGRHGLRRHKRGHRASASRRGGEEEAGDDHRGRDPEAADQDQSGEPEPGDDHGVHAQGENHSRHCGVGDLTEGATVKIAVLVLVDGKAIFKVVGLPKQAPEGEPEAPASE